MATNPPAIGFSGFLPFNGNQVTYEILPRKPVAGLPKPWKVQSTSLPTSFPHNLQRFQTRKGFRSHMLKNNLMISSELHPIKVTCGSIIYYIFRVCLAKIAMFRPNCFVIWGILPYWALPWTTGLGENIPGKISPWKLRIHSWKRKHHLPNILLWIKCLGHISPFFIGNSIIIFSPINVNLPTCTL